MTLTEIRNEILQIQTKLTALYSEAQGYTAAYHDFMGKVQLAHPADEIGQAADALSNALFAIEQFELEDA